MCFTIYVLPHESIITLPQFLTPWSWAPKVWVSQYLGKKSKLNEVNLRPGPKLNGHHSLCDSKFIVSTIMFRLFLIYICTWLVKKITVTVAVVCTYQQQQESILIGCDGVFTHTALEGSIQLACAKICHKLNCIFVEILIAYLKKYKLQKYKLHICRYVLYCTVLYYTVLYYTVI